jgi:hypothetical protein
MDNGLHRTCGEGEIKINKEEEGLSSDWRQPRRRD